MPAQVGRGMRDDTARGQSWRALATVVTVATVGLIAWRWYHYYIYGFGIEQRSLLQVLYDARAALLGLVAIWAAVHRRPLLLVLLCLASVLPETLTRRQEGLHWWVARPSLAYLLAALTLFLTEPRYAAWRARLRPLADRVVKGMDGLFGAATGAEAGSPASRWPASRILAAFLGAAAAVLTIAHYLVMLIPRTFGDPPFAPPRWLYLISILWAMLALAYAIWPQQRLRPWVFILLLPPLLAWTHLSGRERESLGQLELRQRSAEILAQSARASAAVAPVAKRAREAAHTTFAELDGDGDGLLTIEEFSSRPQPLLFDRAGRELDRLEPAIAAYHFRSCDFDQDGSVTEAEWTCRVDVVSRQSGLMSLPIHRQRAFELVDGDRDRRVTLDELQRAPRACRPYADEEVEPLHQRRDEDGDGSLSLAEWSAPN